MAAVPRSDPAPPSRRWLRSRVASFGFALAGVRELVLTQPHARFHLLATLAVVTGGLALGVSRLEWAALVLSIGTVWTAEAVNTSIEWLVDLVHPEWHEAAGRVKDVAAGAVLLSAVAAVITGALVFGPPVYALLSQ